MPVKCRSGWHLQQVMVCPITTEADGLRASGCCETLQSGRACARDADTRNEKINYKVREHSVAKVPVILAVGMREAEGKTVSMRRLGSKDQSVVGLDEAARDLAAEATAPDLRH